MYLVIMSDHHGGLSILLKETCNIYYQRVRLRLGSHKSSAMARIIEMKIVPFDVHVFLMNFIVTFVRRNSATWCTKCKCKLRIYP